jgi:hypothetical protein
MGLHKGGTCLPNLAAVGQTQQDKVHKAQQIWQDLCQPGSQGFCFQTALHARIFWLKIDYLQANPL